MATWFWNGNVKFGTGAGIISGTGSPEGLVSASVGTLFLRTDGGVESTLYVKETGTGNTGWRTSGASSLAADTDVNIVSPLNGQALVFDSISGKWINSSAIGTVVVGIRTTATTIPAGTGQYVTVTFVTSLGDDFYTASATASIGALDSISSGPIVVGSYSKSTDGTSMSVWVQNFDVIDHDVQVEVLAVHD